MAKKHFSENTQQLPDGRCKVSLPWVCGHQWLPSNRALAERKLEGTTRKLKSMGLLEKYCYLFLEWEKGVFIQSVSSFWTCGRWEGSLPSSSSSFVDGKPDHSRAPRL